MRFTYTKRRFSTGARAESRPRPVNFGKNARFAYTKWHFSKTGVLPARNGHYAQKSAFRLHETAILGRTDCCFTVKVSSRAPNRKSVLWQFLVAFPICREIQGPKTLYFTAFSNKPCVLFARNDDFQQTNALVPSTQAEILGYQSGTPLGEPGVEKACFLQCPRSWLCANDNLPLNLP